jgi:hypothetical protein
MRIYGPNATTFGTPAAPSRRVGGSGFSLPEPTETQETRPAGAPKAVGNIDALLAMQGVEDVTEKRKRAVRRGRTALDVLDQMKLALIGGTLDGAVVARLRAAAADLQGSSGDPGLDAVLAEIDLRVAVELAKTGQR